MRAMSAEPERDLVGAERRTSPRIEGTGAHIRLEGEEAGKRWFFAIALRPGPIDKELPVADVSTSGFRLQPYAGPLTVGQAVRVTLVFPDDDHRVAFPAHACVARRGNDGLAAFFFNLRPDAEAFLKAFLGKYPQSGAAAAPPPGARSA